MNNELVSVVVPVYNASKFITDTVLSVKSQTYTDWEMILVDDGSTDNSVEVMNALADEINKETEKLRVIVSNEKLKAAGSRNLGVKNARGRFVAFLDADDLWFSDKLEKQLKLMKEKDCAFSFTGYEFADEDGIGVQKIVRVPEKINYNQAIKNTTIFTSTVMFDLSKLSKEDIEMPNVESEDSATWWKVLKKVPYAYGLNEALTLYRRGDNSLSSNKLVCLRRTWKLYREVEHFSFIKSLYCFLWYVIHATIRRL